MNNTTIQYEGISAKVDQYIKDYCEDCELKFIKAEYKVPFSSDTRTIEWEGTLTIGEELELVDVCGEQGITLTIITEE